MPMLNADLYKLSNGKHIEHVHRFYDMRFSMLNYWLIRLFIVWHHIDRYIAISQLFIFYFVELIWLQVARKNNF